MNTNPDRKMRFAMAARFALMRAQLSHGHLALFLLAGFLVPSPRVWAGDCAKLRLRPQGQYISGGAPTNLATGDLNGDSKIDFALPAPGEDYLSIFYGDGAGKFSGPTKITTGSYPHDVTVADFNNDGRQDLALLISAKVEIFLNNGDGTFGAPADHPVETTPAHIVTADFNQDGNIDVVVSDFESSNLDVLLGTGTGSFGAPIKSVVGTATGGIAVGDLDEDGILDLAFSTYPTEDLRILHGDGAGHFSLLNTYGLTSNGGGIAEGDFNQDGHQDLAVGVYNSSPAFLAIYLGNGDGSFALGQKIAVFDDQAVVAADFNHDGNVDLGVATFGGQSVLFVLGNGTGRFPAPTSLAIKGRNPEPLDLEAADFNGDGRADVVTADYGNGDATVIVSVPCPP